MKYSTDQMIYAFKASNTLEKLVVDSVDEALYFCSTEGVFIYANPAFETIAGYTTQELRENNYIPYFHPDDQEWAMKLWEGLYRGELFKNVEYRIVKKHGDIRWCLSTWKAVYDRNGEKIGILGKQQDITDRKLTEARVVAARYFAEELARTDELTMLNNRRAFFEKGNIILKLANRYQHSMSIIMMDINNFKNVNDVYGHLAGDNVLRTIANLLLYTKREVDILARLSGDEFAFILPETSLDGAVTLAERLIGVIAEVTFEFGNQAPIHITASFGVCACSIKNESIESLLDKADTAMYAVKNLTGSQIGAVS